MGLMEELPNVSCLALPHWLMIHRSSVYLTEKNGDVRTVVNTGIMEGQKSHVLMEA